MGAGTDIDGSQSSPRTIVTGISIIIAGRYNRDYVIVDSQTVHKIVESLNTTAPQRHRHNGSRVAIGYYVVTDPNESI